VNVAITEMDVRTDTGGSRSAKLAIQRRVYADAARACRRQHRCTSFTTWGVSDKHSWWGPGLMPLLFDTSLRPKAAYGDVNSWIRKP
jgi:endo-1,4-beta-xylanase